MKYNQYLSAAFAFALSAFGMVSCSEDIESPEIENIPGKKVHMSINVSRENLAPDTKGEFNIDENGKLKFSWDSTDVIEVRGEVYGNMQHLGTLTLEGTGNGAAGNFSGDVELIGETGDYHFYYLGEKSVGENDTKCEFILPHQDMTLAGLAKSDVQRAKATLTYASNGLIGDVALARAFAFATVTVTLPTGVNTPDSGVDVTFSGEGISSIAQVSLTDASAAVSNAATSNADVTLKMNGNVNSQKFYMNILPGELKNLKVTTEINGKTYTAEKLTDSSKATVANTNYNIVFTMEEEEVELDGTIFGLKWTDSNMQSWVDHDWNYDDVGIITYVPGVPLKDQGYPNGFGYSNKTIFYPSDNTGTFFYQWDRDFGFMAYQEDYDGKYYCWLPNCVNDWYYEVIEYQLSSLDSGLDKFDCIVYLGTDNPLDWCSVKDRFTWSKRFSERKISAQPTGFRIPTAEEFKKLLPEESGKEYSYSQNFTYNSQKYYPFFVKSIDGSTYVWSVMISENNNYLSIDKLKGSYKLSDINSDLIKNKLLGYVDLKVAGRTLAGALTKYGSEGAYWASDSEREGYANCFYIVLNTSKKTIQLQCKELPRTYGLSVRCVYDE